MSTFHGLEVARRALSTQQSALYTTGHNIANANTEGYTRQRVNFSQTSPYPPASRNRPEIPGQVGSGVEAGSVQRVRDHFLDVQFRGENSKLGYYQSKTNAMTQMEAIMNEPSDYGLSKTIDEFWQALQDLSVNPEDSGARTVVRQRGVAVAETFNYLSNSLNEVRGDLKDEISVTETEINSIIDQINNVNQQIGDIEPHGYLPNDLYDERDRLIDKLSGIININVTYEKSGGQPSPMAMGKATITLKGNGSANGVELVNGEKNTVNHLFVNFDNNNNVEQLVFYNNQTYSEEDLNAMTSAQIDALTTGAEVVQGYDFGSNGKFKALIESNGYLDSSGNAVGEYNTMLSSLNEMANTLVIAFNNTHQAGTTLNGTAGLDFFTGDSASTIDVHNDIKTDVNNIAASANGDNGDGTNAQLLSEVFDDTSVSNLPGVGIGANTSVRSYYQSAIGDMAVITQEAKRMVNNATVLTQQVEENRQSVSGVSLDEEMTNMIKFQHAYNAAARSMTAIDEMLDRIINNMGLVGR